MRTTRAFVRQYPWAVATLFVGAMGLGPQLAGYGEAGEILVIGFAIVVALVEGARMVRALLRGSFGLDVLAVTAILATLAVGEYWASYIIVAMLTGGEALEHAASRRAQRELHSLFERVPRSAHRKDEHGAVIEIPIDQVVVGHTLVVRPGEVVPVDGLLRHSAAEFDESSLTGESLPVEKLPGDEVLSGSINGSSAVEIEAIRLARDSEYQQIVSLVEAAASSKAPLVRLADRYAIPFTAVAYAIASVAWWLSGDATRFAEVLVVATPCPLLIAAPVAFLGGMSRAASKGIVIKDAGSLERLARVQTVAFDKTGTLTEGHPSVVEIVPEPASEMDADEFLSIIASAEQHSSHVVAEGLLHEAKQRGVILHHTTESSQVGTDGIRAFVAGREVVIGKPGFVARYCGEFTPRSVEPGHIVVYAALDGVLAGSVTLSDTLRGDSASALSELRPLGIRHTVVVSGDSAVTTAHIATQLGIAVSHGDCLPGDKVRIVQGLQPRPVMMVGDGVNDAPVLAASDVGVALGARGSTAASESAPLVGEVSRPSVIACTMISPQPARCASAQRATR